MSLEGDALERAGAEKLTILARLRGLVGVTIEWRDGQYHANGEACGRSVHGVYEWLDRQGAK
jgi:hypothetical protein